MRDYTPPHSVEAEMSAIGAMFLAGSAAREVAAVLEPSDFYRPAHRRVFRAVVSLVAKRTDVDFVTIESELGSDFEGVGGLEYLIQLAESVPSAGSASHYAGIVKDMAALRRAAEACENGLGVILDNDREPQDRIDWLQQQVGSIRTGKRPWSSMDEISLSRSRPVALKTCWPELDMSTSFRGLTKGEPHLVQADTGIGKSLLLSMLARKWALEDGLNVVIVSLELTKEFVKRRMLFQATGIWSLDDAHEAGVGAVDEYKRAELGLCMTGIDVFDYADSPRPEDRSIETVLADLQAYMASRPVDAVLIDYVQMLGKREGRGNFADHNANAHYLKWFAKHTGVCLVEASQVKLKEGRMQNRGGQEYEDAAASILELTHDEKTGYRLMNKKARHGKRSFIDLELDTSRLVFKSKESEYDSVYRGGE